LFQELRETLASRLLVALPPEIQTEEICASHATAGLRPRYAIGPHFEHRASLTQPVRRYACLKVFAWRAGVLSIPSAF
jgi:hypothetical protein